ncbi:MAG: type III-A CRISPR-associated protein Csm2 [Bacteroidaceae bacterium]|uniref:type III-A CRISPR-associated protein Csm2 n=1 Tax=Fusobacterium varium TaxID=856 RepID=UPI00242B9614|nr:type III-A CRISPR-associated protein Csm2 [Fusobacterium varium]MCF0171263.1 type III-A CRISPR-associated protein Csm2 [Fusobacterium varium]MCF0188761.1 type III-A CRISPR-associated protein Csm2 [Bacteroidaceae bacterium]
MAYLKDDKPEIELIFKDKGFADIKGNIREDLITKEALSIAKYFKRENLSNSQLRAFFNEVKAINNRLEDNENFEKVYPMILMIKSKVEYRASKNDEKRKMKGFKTFLIEAINYIQKENKSEKGYKAFKDFVIFFEAIVGYSYGEGITK